MIARLRRYLDRRAARRQAQRECARFFIDACHVGGFGNTTYTFAGDLDIDAIYRSEQDPEEVTRRMRKVVEG